MLEKHYELGALATCWRSIMDLEHYELKALHAGEALWIRSIMD